MNIYKCIESIHQSILFTLYQCSDAMLSNSNSKKRKEFNEKKHNIFICKIRTMTIISSVTFSILVQSVSQSKNLMIKQRKKRICVTNKNKKLILKVTNLVCHVNFEMCVCRGIPKHYSVCPSIN